MSEYYTRKYKRKGSKKRLWIFLGVLLAILIFIIVFFQTNVNRVLVSVSEATVQAMTTTAVNDAVFQTMENTSSYEDLVSIERNNAGDIVAITSDSLKINSLARRTASVAQKNLSELSAGGVRIPLGAFSGIEILAGTGPRKDRAHRQRPLQVLFQVYLCGHQSDAALYFRGRADEREHHFADAHRAGGRELAGTHRGECDRGKSTRRLSQRQYFRGRLRFGARLIELQKKRLTFLLFFSMISIYKKGKDKDRCTAALCKRGKPVG